jgi:hypothetical protein
MIPKSYKKWAKIYKLFAEETYNNLDFSDESSEEGFLFETYGKRNLEMNNFSKENNGFIIGKKLMDIALKEWKEDFNAGLWFFEDIDRFPPWFKYKIMLICWSQTWEEHLKYPNFLRVDNYNMSMEYFVKKLNYRPEKYIKSMEDNCKNHEITLNQEMEFCEIKGDNL